MMKFGLRGKLLAPIIAVSTVIFTLILIIIVSNISSELMEQKKNYVRGIVQVATTTLNGINSVGNCRVG